MESGVCSRRDPCEGPAEARCPAPGRHLTPASDATSIPLHRGRVLPGDVRQAIVGLRIAYRQAHFGDVSVPQDPGMLILHHGSLRAMVQGSCWDEAGDTR